MDSDEGSGQSVKLGLHSVETYIFVKKLALQGFIGLWNGLTRDKGLKEETFTVNL